MVQGTSMFDFSEGTVINLSVLFVIHISISSSSEFIKPIAVYLEHCSHIIDKKQSQYLTCCWLNQCIALRALVNADTVSLSQQPCFKGSFKLGVHVQDYVDKL